MSDKIQDRIWLGFESGDQEVFQFDGQDLYQIQSEKQKEHEAPLTALDYNKNLGLTITSDESGIIRIWDQDKKFLREIVFPHRVDSVCFYNAAGDILVSHEKRVSLINFKRYRTSSFNYVEDTRQPVKLIPATDELFENLKAKDEQVRGKKVTYVVESSDEESEQESIVKTHPSPELNIRSLEVKYQQIKKRNIGDVDIEEEIALVKEANIEMQIRIQRNLDQQADQLKGKKKFELKPYDHPAIPRKKGKRIKASRPIPGVSYLSTTGVYDEIMAGKQ